MPPMIRIKIKIGFGATIMSAARAARPTSQNAGWSAATIPSAVERRKGSRLKRFRKKPRREGRSSPSRRRAEPADAAAPSRPEHGPASATAPRARRRPAAVSRDRAPRNGMNIGAEGEAPSPQPRRMPHLVDEDEDHEAERRTASPRAARTRRSRRSSRAPSSTNFSLKSAKTRNLNFAEQEPERGDRRPEPAQDVARGLRPLDRRVVVRRLLGLARRVWVQTHRLRVVANAAPGYDPCSITPRPVRRAAVEVRLLRVARSTPPGRVATPRFRPACEREAQSTRSSSSSWP